MAKNLKKTAARGYGGAHQKLRAEARELVDTGTVHCWRCGVWLPPGGPFDLGHDDHDRTIYRGPECVPCNRATSGRRPSVTSWSTACPRSSPRSRTCEICGAGYKAGWSGQRACSRACGVEIRKRNAPFPATTTQTYDRCCSECEQSFTTTRTLQLTCSPGCSKARAGRKSREHYHLNPEYRAATMERSRQSRWKL